MVARSAACQCDRTTHTRPPRVAAAMRTAVRTASTSAAVEVAAATTTLSAGGYVTLKLLARVSAATRSGCAGQYDAQTEPSVDVGHHHVAGVLASLYGSDLSGHVLEWCRGVDSHPVCLDHGDCQGH